MKKHNIILAIIYVVFLCGCDVKPVTSGTCAIISDTIVEPDDIIRVDYNITVDGKKFKGHYAGPVIFIYGS